MHADGSRWASSTTTILGVFPPTRASASAVSSCLWLTDLLAEIHTAFRPRGE
jgi:hypothetical protein